MNKVIPADVIPGMQLTAEQRIHLHDLMCDLYQSKAPGQEVETAFYGFASELLASRPQQSDIEQPQEIGKLMWHLRFATPVIYQTNLTLESITKLREVIAVLQEKAFPFDKAIEVLQQQLTQCITNQHKAGD